MNKSKKAESHPTQSLDFYWSTMYWAFIFILKKRKSSKGDRDMTKSEKQNHNQHSRYVSTWALICIL